MGIRKSAKSQQEPIWKKRTESDIARLGKDLSRLDDWLRGTWKKEKKQNERRTKEQIHN